jgi:SAM-dependent methyltransferase
MNSTEWCNMFNQANVDQCLASYGNDSIRSVLVIGCGTAEDIRAFRNRIGSEPLIVGIDIDIRSESVNVPENSFLIQTDITKSPILGNCFDIAYSFATFEHIKLIGVGWQSMINSLRVGGLLWSVSSPLWRSPYGHHKPMFQNHPWVHLEMQGSKELLNYCEENGINSHDGIDMVHHCNYIYNPDCFNMHSSKVYFEEPEKLNYVTISQNNFNLYNPVGVEAYLSRLEIMGYDRNDLLAVTHRLVGRRVLR